MGNDIQEVKKQSTLQTTHSWITKLSAFADASNLKFSDYQKEIVVNTVRKIQEQGFDIYDYDTNNVADVLYQTAFMLLNPSASPRHCYFISRDVWDNGKKTGKKLEVNIEGEGNDEILRKFGVGIQRDANNEPVGVGKVMVISEHDEYRDGDFNGFEFTPPTWIKKPTPIGKKKGRVIKVVYPIRLTNGRIEYWGAERADLQPIILKHIEKNLTGFMRAEPAKYRELMKKLQALSFDEIIEDYQDYEVEFTSYGKSYKVRVVQDSYTGSTGEAMIIRKLRNLAIRTFPKNFDQTEIRKIYEMTFEEKYDKPSIAERSHLKLEGEKQQEANTVKVDDTQENIQEEDVVVILDDEKPKKVKQSHNEKTENVQKVQEVPMEKVQDVIENDVQDGKKVTSELEKDIDEFFQL